VRYVDALLCVAALLIAEWLAVGAGSASQLAGAYELHQTLATLVPLAMVAAMPLALGGAWITMGVTEPTTTRTRLSVSVPATLLACAVAVGVSGGRLLAGGRRPIFVLLVTAAVAALGWYGSARAARVLSRVRARGRGWLLAAIIAVVLVLEGVNAWVLPRLYPAFHLGLSVLTLWVATTASLTWPRDASVNARKVLAAVIVLVSLPLAFTAPHRMLLYDNIRFIYLERAPLLSNAVRLGAWLAPPPPVEDPLTDDDATRSTQRHVDFSGRDILLITIDALRADHVGSYGYSRPTTPQLDQLAAEGVVFEAAYTATPHTSYAITSLMTGKYMRPLLRQGVGAESQTWAEILQRFGYHTAAFYPPAAFFVDRERFDHLRQTGLGFEYRKQQFASAAERVAEVKTYLSTRPTDAKLLLWVHLFEPHEPYEPSETPFGDRSIDRYDAEIVAADAGLGQIVAAVRAARPRTLVIVSADHGEEFGDHGGRYHGTTVYDEQVRVPLVFHAPGLLSPRRVRQPVGLVDLLPTVLRGLGIPISPRMRGRDVGAYLVGQAASEGFAFAETDEQTLLAQGSRRLLCARRIGACRLFDTATDPGQTRDISAREVASFSAMKRKLGGFVSSLGRYESSAVRWPRALRRGMAGDVEAAMDVAMLLDDATVEIRRKAAEVLFELRRDEVATQLRRTLRRDEDVTVRRWCALALTRLGQGASLTFDLFERGERDFKRLAALALAEAGDRRGERVLIDWWRAAYPEEPRDAREVLPFERAKEVVAGLARIQSRSAIGPLTWGLRDVRLRRWVARALATIGDEAARPALARALADERYHDARVAIAEALVSLDAQAELRLPLTRFLGVPDPMDGGLAIAVRADVLKFVGGPRVREVRRLRQFATSGVTVGIVVPESRHATGAGLRVLISGKTTDGAAGQVRFGLKRGGRMSDGDRSQLVPKSAPSFDPALTVTLKVPAGDDYREIFTTLPKAVSDQVRPGDHADFVIYATQNVDLRACAVVPLAAEVPPPPPEPWMKP